MVLLAAAAAALGGRKGVVVMGRMVAMTMGGKQSSVNFGTIDKEVTNIQLSCQIQSVSL